MPYAIRRKGGFFTVEKSDGSKVFGRHPTRKKAEAQLRAILANTKGH